MKKNKILVVDCEYHIHNANTLIVNRICKQLEEKYDVTICAIDFDNLFACPKHSSDLQIVDLPFHTFKSRTVNKPFDYSALFVLKVVQKLLHSEVDVVNSFFGFRDFIKLVRRNQETNYDIILSFSCPFSSHLLSGLVSRKLNIPWVACYFDPFFSNETMDVKLFHIRKYIEEHCVKNADSVLMTYPTNGDYIKRNISFSDLITGCELPGIRKELYRKTVSKKDDKYKFVFVGNLYKDIRNPDSVIKLFSELGSDYELSFFGGYYGDTIDLNDIPKNVHFHDSVSSDMVPQIYSDADFLLNIGNTITNQMPSKIFEYISTGKPIVNIVKNDNCPTLKYMNNYPLAANIFENDIYYDLENAANCLKQFCDTNYNIQLSFAEITERFCNNLDDSLIRVLKKEIDDVLCKSFKEN